MNLNISFTLLQKQTEKFQPAIPVQYPGMWHVGLFWDLNHVQCLVNFCFPCKNEAEIPQPERLKTKDEYIK
jgi:hypothetical protein